MKTWRDKVRDWFELAFWLLAACFWVRRPRRRRPIHFDYKIEQPIFKGGEKQMLELTITNEQKITIHLKPVTQAGKPTKLDGKPVWTVLSGPGTVVPAEDGLSADLVSDDTDLSDTTYQVTADSDLGAGVEEVADTILVHTAHANAKSLGLFADAPVLK